MRIGATKIKQPVGGPTALGDQTGCGDQGSSLVKLVTGRNLWVFTRQSTCFFGVAAGNAAVTIGHEPVTHYD